MSHATPAPSTHELESTTILRALLRRSDDPTESERLEQNYYWTDMHLPMLHNVLDRKSFELLRLCRDSNRAYCGPTLDQLWGYGTIGYFTPSDNTSQMIDPYAEKAANQTPATTDDLMAMLDTVVASRTYPNGPIRRHADGTFVGGDYDPFVTGSPTERLVWALLYYRRRGATSHGLHDIIGGSKPSLYAAIRSLVARGVCRRSWSDHKTSFVELVELYTPQSADERERYSRHAAQGTRWWSHCMTYDQYYYSNATQEREA